MTRTMRRAVHTETFPTLTAEERAALQAFAQTNGRIWKAKLAELWVKAAAEPVLHRLRNSHGPDWLRTYSPFALDDEGCKNGEKDPGIEVEKSLDARIDAAIKAEIVTLRKAGYSKAYICERSLEIEERVTRRVTQDL